MYSIFWAIFFFGKVYCLDFRSKNTPNDFSDYQPRPPTVEHLSRIFSHNPYRQLLPDENTLDLNILNFNPDTKLTELTNNLFDSHSTTSDQVESVQLTPGHWTLGPENKATVYPTRSTVKSSVDSFFGSTNVTTADKLFATSPHPPTITITRIAGHRSSRIPARLSKLNHATDIEHSRSGSILGQPVYGLRKANAHISVPSHRLLNDILVIPSNRRLYILAILPIHESADGQGFECGNVDVNSFVRLSAFLKALDDVNSGSQLRESGLHIGAVIIDSCSSDLRTLADLYELLSGTNIEKNDIIALVRDDSSHLPNIDEFALTTGTLPLEAQLLTAIVDLLKHTHSTCVSVIFDDLHAPTVKKLPQLASEKEICLDAQLHVSEPSTVEAQQAVVRKLLLSEARIVIVLYGEKSWLDLMKAVNNEMVIPGRFVFVSLQNERWSTSRMYLESWPHFDQLLLTATSKSRPNYAYLTELTNIFPKLPFPQTWLRQFWTTAFQCHIDGEKNNGGQFSRPCPHQESLNLTAISPDLNIAPITFAVHTLAVALRRLSDSVCPGALIHTLTDCLNDPYRSLFAAILSAEFAHPLADEHFTMNNTTGYPKAELVLNRVIFEHGELKYEEIAVWNSETGLKYIAGSELIVAERDGSRSRVLSKCPKSSCSSETLFRHRLSGQPTFKSGLHDLTTLIFAGIAILWTFICLMCMYQQLVGNRDDPYRICTIIMFGGLAMLSLISIFFIMSPSWLTCVVRKTCLSVAIATIFGPILVKTVLIWRNDILQSQGGYSSKTSVSSLVMCWLSLGIAIVQIVIVTEWAIFEDPTLLEFVHFGEKYGWRCAPGHKFEQNLFHSMILNVFLVVSSLLCSVLSVKNADSRQHILISVLALVIGVALYLTLPLVQFPLRDQFFSGVILVFAMLVVFIIYCKRVFLPYNNSNSSENLVDKSFSNSDDKASQISMGKRLYSSHSSFSPNPNVISLPTVQMSNRASEVTTLRADTIIRKQPLSYRSSIASDYRTNYA
uniref:G-protein coupled receptors family 3 profile domain-containing protein n=1 Tax=Acrobeloides nanus TaxID=290746 RepID=A0A914BVN5_9BILA